MIETFVACFCWSDFSLRLSRLYFEARCSCLLYVSGTTWILAPRESTRSRGVVLLCFSFLRLASGGGGLWHVDRLLRSRGTEGGRQFSRPDLPNRIIEPDWSCPTNSAMQLELLLRAARQLCVLSCQVRIIASQRFAAKQNWRAASVARFQAEANPEYLRSGDWLGRACSLFFTINYRLSIREMLLTARVNEVLSPFCPNASAP